MHSICNVRNLLHLSPLQHQSGGVAELIVVIFLHASRNGESMADFESWAPMGTPFLILCPLIVLTTVCSDRKYIIEIFHFNTGSSIDQLLSPSLASTTVRHNCRVRD